MTRRRPVPTQQAAVTDPQTGPAAATLLNLMVGAWITQAISVAARLGIADLLEDGPRSSAELAQATGTHPRAVYRLLRALASLGIFAEDANGRFELTPLAEGLRTGATASVRGYAIYLGEACHWRSWGELLHSVRTGDCAFEHVFGMPVFDYFAEHADAAELFDDAMTSRGTLENRAIATAYDFPSGAIVDVAGGRGSLLATILQDNPEARGILFDLPHVIERAAPLIRAASVADRCQFISGDFFDGVPAGGDIYLMKKIIHDWDDTRARAILANCRGAMADHSRLLLLEEVISPGNTPAFGKLIDLSMLVQTPGGQERTEAEYRTLLGTAGLELTRIVRTGCSLRIIEAIPRQA
jgi:hypothetical protein